MERLRKRIKAVVGMHDLFYSEGAMGDNVNVGLMIGFVVVGIFGVIVFTVVIGWMIFVVWITSRRVSRLNQELGRIASCLGGRVEGRTVRLRHREREATVSHWQSQTVSVSHASGSVSRYLQFRTGAAGNFHLMLSRQQDHGLSKLLFSELKVGDPELDDNLFIQTDDADPVRAFLLDPIHRQAVLALFERQFDWLSFDPGTINAVKKNYGAELNNPALILGHLDLLYQLSA